MSEIKEKQFIDFFQDQDNVSQSSYQTDPKSGLPIVYLQDQKNALWTKFENTYSDGMRKTSFITCLANTTQLRYRDDLGGLCQTCNDYGYETFDNLLAIIRNAIKEKALLVS